MKTDNEKSSLIITELFKQLLSDPEYANTVLERLRYMVTPISKNITEKKSAEQVFLEIIQDMKQSTNADFPESVFYGKDNTIYFEKENNILWVGYYKVWSVFSKEFNMNNNDIQLFIKDQVEKHLKWKDVTPMLED